jgi:hypothetical protein
VKITITPNRAFYEALGLVKDWGKRAAAVRRYTMREVARSAERELKSRLSASREYGDLSKAVKLFSVQGTDSSYLLTLRAKERGGRDLDPKKTVIFITPRKHATTPTDAATTILARYNPWTLDTLPIAPKRRYAVVIYRSVSEKAVIHARRAIIRNRIRWEPELARAGAVVSRNPVNLLSVRTAPDISAMSMNLEFGLRGESKPHWRPTILSVKKGKAIRAAMKAARRAMVDPRYMGWKSWSTDVGAAVNVSELKKYAPFQSKMGIL